MPKRMWDQARPPECARQGGRSLPRADCVAYLDILNAGQVPYIARLRRFDFREGAGLHQTCSWLTRNGRGAPSSQTQARLRFESHAAMQ